MPWPTPQDYNEAIQNPRLCFSDRELKAASPDLTPLGLPRPITGNFASVYRVRTGTRNWAVRCFWRQFADLQTRYAAISAHLAAARLPYTVGFQYLEEGILVRGTWYPVLKMEWVEGELLDDYLERNLHDRSALERLAGEWLKMCRALERAGIAHGDLQHGNVLVTNDRLVLVDYDGMYVPALRGKVSHETGHPNYQHPGRTGADFGPNLDHFSEWSIYLSLLATAGQPELWEQMKAGDECLLFRRSDYESPDDSPSYAALATHPELEIRTRTERFRGFLDVPLERVPRLEQGGEARAEGASGLPVRRDESPIGQVVRRLVPSVPAEVAALPAPRPRGGPEWLADHVALPEETRDFDSPHPAVRLAIPAFVSVILASVILLLLFAVPALPVIGIDVLSGLTLVTALIVSYRLTVPLREVSDLLWEESVLKRDIRDVWREIDDIEGICESLTEDHAQCLAELRRERETARDEEEERRTELAERRDARLEELRTARKVNTEREASDLERALQSMQAGHIRTLLRSATVRSASIPGVRWTTKLRLLALGVWSAADLSAQKIRTVGGMDEDELLALVSWRVECERTARRTAPRSLPPDVTAAIGGRYARARDKLDTNLRACEAAWRADDADIAAAYADIHDALDRQEEDVRRRFEVEKRRLEGELATLRAEVPGLETQLRQVYSAMFPYRRTNFRRYLQTVLGNRASL